MILLTNIFNLSNTSGRADKTILVIEEEEEEEEEEEKNRKKKETRVKLKNMTFRNGYL